MNMKALVASVATMLIALTGCTSVSAAPVPPSQSSASSATTPVASATASATPTQSASATPTTEPTPSIAGPTEGPESDYAITKSCATTPTRPPYVGLCKSKKWPELTGRQAFQACVAASNHMLWLVPGSGVGKQDKNSVVHEAQCLGSLGMGGVGMFFGYIGEDGAMQYMVISGIAKNGQRYDLPFDAKTGKLTYEDGVMETVEAWYEEHLQGG